MKVRDKIAEAAGDADDGRHAHGQCGSQNGAGVVRIHQTVEQQQESGRPVADQLKVRLFLKG